MIKPFEREMHYTREVFGAQKEGPTSHYVPFGSRYMRSKWVSGQGSNAVYSQGQGAECKIDLIHLYEFRAAPSCTLSVEVKLNECSILMDYFVRQNGGFIIVTS